MFESVTLLFLLLGHTHWICDQLFSAINKLLKSIPGIVVVTPEEFVRTVLSQVNGQFDAETFITEIENVPNWNAWFDQVCRILFCFFTFHLTPQQQPNYNNNNKR